MAASPSPAPAASFTPDVANVKDQGAANAIQSLARLVGAEFGKVLYRNRSQSGVLLLSPGGKSYNVTVDDAGNLTTKLVQG